MGALSSSTAASLGLGYFNDMAPFVGDANAYYTDSDVNFFSSGTGQQIFTDIKTVLLITIAGVWKGSKPEEDALRWHN